MATKIEDIAVHVSEINTFVQSLNSVRKIVYFL